MTLQTIENNIEALGLPKSWVRTIIKEIGIPQTPKIEPSRYPDEFFELYSVPSFLTGKAETTKGSEIRSSKQLVVPGDILLCKIIPRINRVWVVNSKEGYRQIASTEWIVLRNNHMNSWFIKYCLSEPSFREEFLKHVSGVGGSLMRARPQSVANIQVSIAPINEQNRIVSKIEELFSQLDDGEAALKRAQKLVEQYRQSVLKAAVTGELTKDWREKHKGDLESGEALLQRILQARREVWEEAELARLKAKGKTPKDDKWKAKYKEPPAPDTSNLPELPDGWSWATMDAIADITGGVTVDAKRKIQNGITVPYLRVANVQRGYLDLKEIKVIEVSKEVFQALKLQPGDILFNEGGDRDKLGRGWVWSSEIEGCIHQNHVFRARCYLEELSGKFISWYGNVMAKQYFMSQGKQTTNLASISLTKLKALPVPIPSLKEMSEVVNEVEDVLSVNGHYLASLQASEKLSLTMRQGILKAAFSGQLVPQDPNDEPASELLKRIALERSYLKPSEKPKRKSRRAKK